MYYITKDELEKDIEYISKKLKYYDYDFTVTDIFTKFVDYEDGVYEIDEVNFALDGNSLTFEGRNRNNEVKIKYTPPNKFYFTDYNNISAEFYEINGVDYYLNAINKKSLKWVLTGRF